MLDKVYLILGLILAFSNLYFSLKELVPNAFVNKVDSRNLSFALSISLVSATIIYIGINSIGPISFLISFLSGILIFLISITIFQNETRDSLEEK